MQKFVRNTTIFLSILTICQLIACGERPKFPDSHKSPPSADQAGDESQEPSKPAIETGENSRADAPASPTPAATPPGTDKPDSTAATGSTAISFTPVRYAGAQYPAYVYAVWITDASNKYIKTVSARAANRMRYLDKWLTAAGVVAPTQPDGVAGATINFPATPSPIAVSWDMKDKAGAFVPQGNYTINIQLTSSNNTGLSLTVPVMINAAGIMKTDTTMTTGITAFSAKHTP